MAIDSSQVDGGIYPRGFPYDTNWPWPLVKSKDVVKLNYGKALRQPDRRPGSVPVYGTNGQCGWHDAPLTIGPGVILGRKGQGPLGVEWCDTDFWVIDTAYFAKPTTDSLDLRFFYYLTKYIGLNHLKDGTSNPSLSRDTFADLLLPLPPMKDQQAIVQIVSTLDDKIELNRRMNETLESMARAIFKSWFVDFDPVRAKMDGREPVGMDAETAQFFPSSFASTEIGCIPSGWGVARLGEHIEAVKGLSYKGSGLSEVGFPLHNLNSVYEGGGYKHEGIKFYTGEHRDRHFVYPGDVIIANTEQGHDCLLLGYAAMIPKRLGERGLYSHHLYRVRPLASSHVKGHYWLYLFNSRRMHDTVSGYGNGTTVNMLPIDALYRPQFVVPPKELTDTFERVASTAFELVETRIKENRRLAALRDTLLPKLLSGEIRVAEAEQEVCV